MRGFAVIFLMVMMLALLAPMTVMAQGGMGDMPMLAMTMDKWSDVVTATQRAGPKGELAQLRELYNFMDYSIVIGSIGDGPLIDAKGNSQVMILDKSDISATAMASAAKAGGAAIFAIGKPRAVADTLI